MDPPPIDPCLFNCDATRNWFLKHNKPKGGEQHVGMWNIFSPVSMSHIVTPILMLWSLHATNASRSSTTCTMFITKLNGVCVCDQRNFLTRQRTKICVDSVCFLYYPICTFCLLVVRLLEGSQ